MAHPLIAALWPATITLGRPLSPKYSYASLASSTGLPIIRPLVLLDQSDPNMINIGHTYHFGNEFLVAPMITPNANSRQVYLPAGNWINFWSNVRHTGGQNIQWNNPDQAQFPLFVRDGAVIPMLLNDTDSLCDANYINNPAVKARGDGLSFLVFPAGSSGFTVYDGTTVQCAHTGAGTTLTLSSAARPIQLQVFTSTPATVTRDGAALTMFASQAQFSAGSDGWVVAAQPGFILIKFQHAGRQHYRPVLTQQNRRVSWHKDTASHRADCSQPENPPASKGSSGECSGRCAPLSTRTMTTSSRCSRNSVQR